MNNNDANSKIISEKVLKWFHGPVERYINEEQAIINAVVMTTPFHFTVLGWVNASRDHVAQRLQSGITTVGRGDRRTFGNVVAFEFAYKKDSGIIIPG